MDAQDFIPAKANIDVTKAYFLDDVENLATNDDIVKKVRTSVRDFEDRFIAQRDHYTGSEDGIWNLCDWAFRGCINDTITQTEKSKGANEPDEWERAKTGTTQFYRQVTQKASNGYAVQTSKIIPFKYTPLHDEDTVTQENAEEQSEKMNLLAKWTMKKDKFNRKSMDFWTQIYKYGNIPIMVEWYQRIGRKKIQVPVIDQEDPSNVTGFDTIEKEYVVENRPVLRILPIESVKADTRIGNIQDQDCVIVSTVVGISDIVDGIKTGIYREDMLKDLNKSHQWDGTTGIENDQERRENRDDDDGTLNNSFSGRYLKREIFVRLPIDEDKKRWDEKKYAPMLFRVTMFGNYVDNSVVARVERNQEPDDTIPIEMIHANPDDSDFLYHISNFEVIRSNIATETTLIRQIIDNNTMVNKPPLWEVKGAVTGNDRRFGPDARYKVDTKDSIGFMQIRDVSQPSLGILNYMKEDSNTANSIDKNMIGESFGARTSASEANTISSNSRRPNLVNIEYVLDQYLGFYANRIKVNWEAYGRVDQMLQITDKNENPVFIRPKEIVGDFDVVIDIVDDIQEKEMKAQRMLNYAQTIATTPMAQLTDWYTFSQDLSEYMMGTDKYVIENPDGDVEDVAMRNIALMVNGGQFPVMSPNMNLKKHLAFYEAERMRWRGYEDQNPNITGVLDPVIEQIKARIEVARQPQATPVVQTQGQLAGQQISGAIGGI